MSSVYCLLRVGRAKRKCTLGVVNNGSSRGASIRRHCMCSVAAAARVGAAGDRGRQAGEEQHPHPHCMLDTFSPQSQHSLMVFTKNVVSISKYWASVLVEYQGIIIRYWID